MFQMDKLEIGLKKARCHQLKIKEHNVVLHGHLLQQVYQKSTAISILDYNPHSLSRICWIVQVHMVIKVVLEDGWILDLNTSEITALQVRQIIHMQEKIKHAKLQFKEISNMLQVLLMLMVVRNFKLLFQIKLFLLELMLVIGHFIVIILYIIYYRGWNIQ